MRPCTFHLTFFSGLLLTISMTYGQCYYDVGVPTLEIQPSSSGAEPLKYCPMSGGLCPSMLSHLLNLVLLYALLVLDQVIQRNQQNPNRVLDYLIIISSLSYFTTMVIYYYFYVTDFYLIQGEDNNCVMKMPYVELTSGLIFSFYTIFVIASVLVCCYGFYQLFYGIRQTDKLQKNLTKLLENAYFDHEQIKRFYTKNKDRLKDIPLYPIEIRVFKDQFEKEFRYIEKQEYNECCICFFEGFQDTDKVISFPGCGHNFHYDCLDAWIKKRTYCPVCRSEFRDNFSEDLGRKMKAGFMKVSSLDGQT